MMYIQLMDVVKLSAWNVSQRFIGFFSLQLKQGKLTDSSYVPAGLTKAEYEKIREADLKKKEENYKKNVAKAGKFIGFNEWYQKRGTDLSGSWLKSPTRGHNMVKTKYDFSGSKDVKKLDQAL